jgi:hypothetical protein
VISGKGIKMDKRIWKVVFGIFIILTATAVVCIAGQRGGGGRGGFAGRGDPNRQFEIPQEFIDKLMAAIKEKDPAKAKELEILRNSNPAKFREELFKIGPELAKTIWDEGGYGFGGGRGGRGGDGRGGPGGRGQDQGPWSQQRNEDLLKFVRENFPADANNYDKVKNDQELGPRQLRIIDRMYGRLFDRVSDNPQMKDLLIQDFRLNREQLYPLLMKIGAIKDKTEKAKFRPELEKLLGQIYDVKVGIKEKDYDQLSVRLEDLKKTIEKSKEELGRWKDDSTKKAEVKKQTDNLLDPNRPPFGWR